MNGVLMLALIAGAYFLLKDKIGASASASATSSTMLPLPPLPITSGVELQPSNPLTSTVTVPAPTNPIASAPVATYPTIAVAPAPAPTPVPTTVITTTMPGGTPQQISVVEQPTAHGPTLQEIYNYLQTAELPGATMFPQGWYYDATVFTGKSIPTIYAPDAFYPVTLDQVWTGLRNDLLSAGFRDSYVSGLGGVWNV